MNNKIPTVCPSCGEALKVKRLECSKCTTAVEGEFVLPLFARLSPQEQEFLLNLLKESGSLKDLASLYGISYPTVRNRLDSLIEKVERLQEAAKLNPEE